MFENGQSMRDFLAQYYAIGPEAYLSLVGGTHPRLRQVADAYQIGQRDLKKILAYNETNYYRTQYGMACSVWGHYNSEIFKLLDKKPITQVGDGVKYSVEATNYGIAVSSILDTGSIYGTSTETAISTFTNILGAIHKAIISQGNREESFLESHGQETRRKIHSKRTRSRHSSVNRHRVHRPNDKYQSGIRR
jgi:hypothetical protein